MTHSAIGNARESARHLRAALFSGSLEELEESLPALTDAAQQLRSLEKRASADPAGLANPSEVHSGDLRGELMELRKALGSAAWLVENGAALQQGWARMLGAAVGYTASGDAAPLPSTTRIQVTG
jgi:hypothetical protein